MKTAIIICTLAATAASLVSLKLGWPDDAQQRYYRAHNEVEEIAFRKSGSEELQKAVTHERAAEKDLFVVRDLGRRMLWMATGLSAATFVLGLMALRQKKPIQLPEPTSGLAPGRGSS